MEIILKILRRDNLSIIGSKFSQPKTFDPHFWVRRDFEFEEGSKVALSHSGKIQIGPPI